MERKSVSMYIVPSTMSEIPGEFMLYLTIVDYEGKRPTEARTILAKHVNFPGAGDTHEVEWAIDVCDRIYQELTREYAGIKIVNDAIANARPGDSSVPS